MPASLSRQSDFRRDWQHIKPLHPPVGEAHHIENLNGKQLRLCEHIYIEQQVFHKYRRSSCKIEGRVQRHSQIRWIIGLALHVALPTLLLAGELFTQWTYYHEKQRLGRRSRSKQLHTITPTLIYLPAAA
jgi:hypothetical protein